MSAITAPEMKITALAPWFGGKRTLAPTIIAEAGPHNSWWEPFCGGISIILQKPRARQEVLNDAHGDLTNLAIVVASDRWVELYSRSIAALYSEGFYESCLTEIQKPDHPEFASCADDVSDASLRRAFAYLVLSWMGRNGAAGTERISYQFTLRYTNKGGDSATRWRQVSESIPAWHERLRGVVISRRCGIELAEKIDDAPGTVIYCDPPYLDEGDAYLHKFSAAGMFGDDHLRLAEALRAKKHARVIVSYYDHPRLADLYPGWTVRKLTVGKALAAQNKRGANREQAPEVLLINGRAFA
jgi:DNA adenine methylase